MTGRGQGSDVAAYIMTNHPKLAMTFIADEIAAVERIGTTIVPFAINDAEQQDLVDDEAVAMAERTTYLKGVGPVRLASQFVRYFIADPGEMGRLVWTAVRSAGSTPRVLARRIAHLVYAATVWSRCEREGVSRIHAHFGKAPATIAWFTSEIGRIRRGEPVPWSFTIHGFHDFVDEHDTRLDLKARSAAEVVCISDFTRSQLCRVTDSSLWDRFHVVRCGIDLDRFTFEPQPRRNNGPFRLVIIARLSPEKGHVILLQAMRLLVDAGHDVQLEIVGDGPDSARIRDEVVRLGLADRVAHGGEVPPRLVVDRLRASDVFCLPSFAEGIPMSIMEAMAVGTPVVSTWVGGIPELAIHGETALTVPAGNADLLAGALRRLLTDADLRNELVRAARLQVELHHDLANNAKVLVDLATGARHKAG